MRTALTLTVLVVVTVVGALWGWRAFTEPFPQSEDPPVCRDTTVAAGSKVRPSQVTVSVFNASDRAGLASRTMELFVGSGFGQGERGNAPTGTQVQRAEIWTDEVDNPAVLLVQSYLGQRTVVRVGPSLGPGVTVIVGERFEKLRSGRTAVVATVDATVCSPPSTTT
jgi:hypothetical protein